MITISNVTKNFGRQALLTSASVQLDPGDKVGLVGPNGSGKLSLIHI